MKMLAWNLVLELAKPWAGNNNTIWVANLSLGTIVTFSNKGINIRTESVRVWVTSVLVTTACVSTVIVLGADKTSMAWNTVVTAELLELVTVSWRTSVNEPLEICSLIELATFVAIDDAIC